MFFRVFRENPTRAPNQLTFQITTTINLIYIAIDIIALIFTVITFNFVIQNKNPPVLWKMEKKRKLTTASGVPYGKHE